MQRRCAYRVGMLLLGLIFLAVGGLSCQKVQVSEKKEVLSIRLEHKPVHDHVGKGGQEIRALLISNLGLKEGGIKLLYTLKGEKLNTLPMTPTERENEYTAVIPHQPRGTTVEYSIHARSVTGTPVTLPKNALDTGESYLLTFKGYVSPVLTVIQLSCVLIGLFLILVAGYWVHLFLKNGEKLNAIAKAALGGTTFLFFGGIPLHIIVKYQALGIAWSGIPVGTDKTDSLTLLLILFWVGVLILFKGTLFQGGGGRNYVSDKTFATLVLVGAILTIVVFLVPG